MADQTQVQLGWKSRKLTQQLREEILHRINVDLFQKREQDLEQEKKEMAVPMFIAICGGPENVAAMNALPKSFFRQDADFLVRFTSEGGATVYFVLPEPRSFPKCLEWRVNCPASMQQEFSILVGKIQRLGADKQLAKSKVWPVLNSVNTERQLLNAWPDVFKYLVPPEPCMALSPFVGDLKATLETLRG